MRHRLLLLFGFLIASHPAYAGDPSPHVLLSHDVYQTLDRFDARGWIRISSAGIRPYTRGRVAALLRQILNLADSSMSLSRSDCGRLRRHRAEFRGELAQLGAGAKAGGGAPDPSTKPLDGTDILSWRDSVSHVAVNPILRQRVLGIRGDLAPTETVSQTYLGASVRGIHRGRIGFQIRHFEAREWGSRLRKGRGDVTARPIEDVQLKGNKADFRQADFEIRWTTPWFDVDFGKGSVEWGPAPSSNLLLSGHASSFGMIRLRATYKRLAFIQVIGFLRVRPGLVDSSRTRMDNGYSRTILSSKRLVAHRAEIDLPLDITLGLHECVIYAGRGVDALYLIPPAPLSILQEQRRGADNALFGADVAARPAPNLKLYLAILLDDVGRSSNGPSPLSYALQSGLFWVDAFGSRDTDLRLEYVRLQPGVYSHASGVTTHEHFDALLGHPMGRDSDRVSCLLRRAFTSSLSVDLGASRERRAHSAQDPDTSFDANVFLAGPALTDVRFGMGVDFEPIRHLFFRLDFERAHRNLTDAGGAGRGRVSSSSWSIAAQYGYF